MSDAGNAESQASFEEKPDEKPEPQESEAPESDEWKAEKYRSKVVERIQDEITKTESQVPKTAAELEEFVFSKATSRKSYLDLVTRILIYIAEFNKKKEKKEEEKTEKTDEDSVTEKSEEKTEEKEDS